MKIKMGDLLKDYYSENATSGNTPILLTGNLYFATTNDLILHLATIDKQSKIIPMKSEFSYEKDILRNPERIEKVDYSFIPEIKRKLVLRKLFEGASDD